MQPPEIARQVQQYRGMFPEELQFLDESLLQLLEGGENPIGEPLAQMAKDLLRRVQFGTVRGQIERLHVGGPMDLATVMAGSVVENHAEAFFSHFLAQMLQEDLQAVGFDVGQQEKDACSRAWFDGRIESKPLVLLTHDPGRLHALRAPTTSQPRFEAKAPFIESQHVLELAQLTPEVFFKAFCCSGLAFCCCLRPVFHLT